MTSVTEDERMRVSNVQWLSLSAEEAEVEVTDGHYFCGAFCHPCRVKVGDEIKEPLHIFDIGNLMLSEKSQLGIWSTDERSLTRKVVGRIIDIVEQIVVVGGIRLVIDDPLPGVFQEGNIIEFECARIDLW